MRLPQSSAAIAARGRARRGRWCSPTPCANRSLRAARLQ
ncbi:CGNR zinc finger domain-containing protein [uncultured Agrobacterium sp.]